MSTPPPCDESLRAALDASVECGPGCICLFGPPGSGKTTLLLDYLAARSARLRPLGRALRLEYATARALDGAAAAHFARRLGGRGGKRPRGGGGGFRSSALALAAAAARWARAAPGGSELHLVLDDADAAGGAGEWPCGAAARVWLVAQAPLRVDGCFRHHFVPAPDAETIARWIACSRDEAGGEDDGDDDDEAAAQAHRALCDAAAHYAAQLPMRASLVAHDVRLLLRRAHAALPRLAALVADGRAPNAMHYAAAWAPQPQAGRSAAAAAAPQSARTDPLAAALARVGLSAALLAVSAFYCGAVPHARHAHVFDTAAEATRRAQTHATSHRAAVLSSTAHTVHTARLMRLYDALLRICVHHVDPLELAAADVAVMHVQTLVAWGLLVPLSQGTRAYHCHIPVTSAVELAGMLSLNLYDLIPV